MALCFDEHHRTHLSTFLSERAVEAMVTGTTQVFRDAALQARSVQLHLTPTPKAASAKEQQKPEEKDSVGEQDIEPKPRKDNTEKKQKEGTSKG